MFEIVVFSWCIARQGSVAVGCWCTSSWRNSYLVEEANRLLEEFLSTCLDSSTVDYWLLLTLWTKLTTEQQIKRENRKSYKKLRISQIEDIRKIKFQILN